MTIKTINQIQPRSIDVSCPFTSTEMLGLSTDAKPTNVGAGSTFEETDTGNVYKFDGSAWFLDGNYDVVIKGVSDDKSVPIVSDDRGYLIPIDYLHAIVHEKEMYTISHTFLAVAQNGFARLRIKTNSLALHLEINYTSELKCRLKTYSSPTITGQGTLFQPFNRIIGYGDGTQGFQVYLNPTFTGGVLRGNDFSGSNTGTGGAAVRVGGGRQGGVESVIIPNQEFIMEFQNVGSSASDINVIINCYEKPYI